MLLTQADLDFFSKHNDFFLKIRNGKAFFSVNGRQYRFGSKLYPLGKCAQLFTEHNTSKGEYKDVQETIEKSDWRYQYGRCYSNAEFLQKAFLSHGVDAKYYSGWVFPSPEEPIHHAWVVVDNNVYDIAIHLTSERALDDQVKSGKNPFSKDCLKEIADIKKYLFPLDKHFVWGKINRYLYIGAESSPQQARLQYKKAIESADVHPSYKKTGMNANGMSRYQRLSSQI